jgi:hypothetical protein
MINAGDHCCTGPLQLNSLIRNSSLLQVLADRIGPTQKLFLKPRPLLARTCLTTGISSKETKSNAFYHNYCRCILRALRSGTRGQRTYIAAMQSWLEIRVLEDVEQDRLYKSLSGNDEDWRQNVILMKRPFGAASYNQVAMH